MPITYQPYSSLNANAQENIIRQYRQKFLDFDNDIIVNSAIEVLRANGFDNFNALQVGPERHGATFDLWMQLAGKFNEDKHYTFFSLPTLGGRHSVGVVIDTKAKKCHVIDSLNRCYPDAKAQLQEAINLGILADYTIVTPKFAIAQQNDSWSCGIHTSANIVSIINGDINLETGKGIQPRNANDINHLLGVFSKAYAEISVKRAEALDNPRLNARQKKTLRFALEDLLNQPQTPRLKLDIQTLRDALFAEYPPATDDEDLLKQRPLAVFLSEFNEINPENSLYTLFNDPEFINNLPTTMQENIENKQILLFNFFNARLKPTLTIEKPTDIIAQDKVIAPVDKLKPEITSPVIITDAKDIKVASASPLLLSNRPKGPEPLLPPIAPEKSSLTDAQSLQIQQLINKLQREIDSCWPYPNKDRKAVKVNALSELLKEAKTKDLAEAIRTVEKNFAHQGAFEGKISNRTSELFSDLKKATHSPMNK